MPNYVKTIITAKTEAIAVMFPQGKVDFNAIIPCPIINFDSVYGAAETAAKRYWIWGFRTT